MSSDHHIRNPFELVVEHTADAMRAFSRASPAPRPYAEDAAPAVRRIGAADLKDALREGWGDLGAYRADVVFLAVIYPIAGLVLAQLAWNAELLPLLFPLVSGFALIGPFAAIGLYEISRRREAGAEVSWADALGVLRSPRIGPILVMGLVLLALFMVWIGVAYEIYLLTLRPEVPTPLNAFTTMRPYAPASVGAFAQAVFYTPGGWSMIVIGMTVGFLFAVVALAISVVSFPLLLDRQVGVWTAIKTSIRAVAANPGPMALWGLIVAGLLVLGSLPALLGLIVVMPLLGHATWRLYRKLVD